MSNSVNAGGVVQKH